MSKEEEKTPVAIFTMENEGVARKKFYLSQGPLMFDLKLNLSETPETHCT